MVDTRILEKHGCSAEGWRKLFEGKDRAAFRLKKETVVKQTDELGKKRKRKDATPELPKMDKIDSLIEHIWSRITAGRDWNFQNHSVIYAMDLIWDAPFRQVSPTLLASVCAKHGSNTEEIKSALSGLGLSLDGMFTDTEQTDPKTGKPIQLLNIPTFFAVMVPLVRAYLNIRRARIVNDRNRTPFFEFKAANQSKKNRVRCEVLTSRIQDSATSYDYLGALNQAVFQMFLYPTGCLLFTKEEWDYSEQVRFNDKKEEETFVVREGLRYHSPHPSRTFWDIAHPQRTFNTDTGCSYGGYWSMIRYGDILDNDGFYNRERINIGSLDWFNSTPSFWRTVYNTCAVKLPIFTSSPTPDSPDRESAMEDTIHYTQDMRDKGVMLCEYREKLNPKTWGLGNYDHEIWCRFVVAGDGTIVYAAPIAYPPIVSFKDNGDDKRVSDASLALQLAPYQDQLSNLLTQFLLAAKSNLANLTLLEENVIGKDTIKKLNNFGETYFRGHNFLGYDSKQMFRTQLDPRAAVIQSRFPALDTNGIVLAMKLVLDMAERVLQFSSQEVAQAASHEQTKAEVEQLSAATTNVLEFTALPVDQGLQAMARQNYEALMNYGEDEFYAQIPSDHDLTEKQLKELGITQDEDGETRDKKIGVRATKKSAMRLSSFATITPSNKRVTNWEAAQGISQFMAVYMGNPMTADALGPKQLIEIANGIAELAGLPLKSPLRDATEETQKKQASDLLKQTVDTVLGMVRTEVKQGMEVVMSAVKDVGDQTKSLAEGLGQVYQMLGLNAATPTNPQVGPEGNGGPSIMAQQPAVAAIPQAAPDLMPLGAT